ncbi:MAG: hypothetical protein ABFR33_10295 [Verrucomicrobiota bacterium]
MSILIHAALFLLAGVLVVFTVVKKDEQKFEQPVPVERPKMKLKKPKPRIKKSARPKQAKHILAKVKPVNMPEIQLPELSGMDGDGGLGGGIGGGFDTLPDLGEITIFGGGQTIGNDFEGSYDQELQAEFFAIGTEINGDRYILLDRQKTAFTPGEEKNRSIRFSGRTVELPDFLAGSNSAGRDRRGEKYSSFLVVVMDSRGKIIAHETPKKWLFENLENLKKVPVGKYFDKTCTRTRPTRPKTRYY